MRKVIVVPGPLMYNKIYNEVAEKQMLWKIMYGSVKFDDTGGKRT